MAMATGSRSEIRMILLGKMGLGKSLFGNTILGVKKFESGKSPNPLTNHCKCASRDFDGKQLFVVDTPGFCDHRVEVEEDAKKEVAKAYQVTALPGPHAFLLILKPERITRDNADAIGNLRSIFGENAFKNTIIVFTHGDSFDSEEGTIESYLQKLNQEDPLKELLDQCDWRYLVVNNKGTETEKTKVVQALVEMITTMVAKNHGQVYRTTQFDEIAKVIREEEAKGNYKPINPDGSITLLPKVKEIIVESFLKKTNRKKIVQ